MFASGKFSKAEQTLDDQLKAEENNLKERLRAITARRKALRQKRIGPSSSSAGIPDYDDDDDIYRDMPPLERAFEMDVPMEEAMAVLPKNWNDLPFEIQLRVLESLPPRYISGLREISPRMAALSREVTQNPQYRAQHFKDWIGVSSQFLMFGEMLDNIKIHFTLNFALSFTDLKQKVIEVIRRWAPSKNEETTQSEIYWIENMLTFERLQKHFQLQFSYGDSLLAWLVTGSTDGEGLVPFYKAIAKETEHMMISNRVPTHILQGSGASTFEELFAKNTAISRGEKDPTMTARRRFLHNRTKIVANKKQTHRITLWVHINEEDMIQGPVFTQYILANIDEIADEFRVAYEERGSLEEE